MFESDFESSNSIIAELPSDDQCLSPESKYVSSYSDSKVDPFKMNVHFEDGLLKVEGGRKLKKSELSKLKKIIMKESKSTDDEPSKQEQVATFITKYQKSNYTDVPVTEMRHIIPMLLTEVYSTVYGQWSKKVKGLWENRPEDWPADVPFVDPNNKMKGSNLPQCKPKKEILVKILLYLVKAHTTKQACSIIQVPSTSSDPLLSFSNVALPDKFPVQRQMTVSAGDEQSQYATIEGYTYAIMSDSSNFDNAFYDARRPISETVNFHLIEDFGQEYTRLKVEQSREENYTIPMQPASIGNGQHQDDDDESGVDATRGKIFPVSESGGRPQQVQDNEDDWDPIDDHVQRIKKKIAILEKSKDIAEGHFAPLLIAKDVIMKMCKQVALDKSDFIKKAHLLESAIDIVKLEKGLPLEWQQKLHEFQVVGIQPSDEFESSLMLKDSGAMRIGTSLRGDVVAPTDDIQTETNSSQHIDLSLLNIETRQDATMSVEDLHQLELRTEQRQAEPEVFSSNLKSETKLMMSVEDPKTGGIPIYMDDDFLCNLLGFGQTSKLPDLGTIDIGDMGQCSYDTGPVQESGSVDQKSISPIINLATVDQEKIAGFQQYSDQVLHQLTQSKEENQFQMAHQLIQSDLQSSLENKNLLATKNYPPQRMIPLITWKEESRFLSLQHVQHQMLKELERPFEYLSLKTQERPVLTSLLTEPPRKLQPRIGEKRKSNMDERAVDYDNERIPGTAVLSPTTKCPPIPVMVAELDDFDGHSFNSGNRKKKKVPTATLR